MPSTYLYFIWSKFYIFLRLCVLCFLVEFVSDSIRVVTYFDPIGESLVVDRSCLVTIRGCDTRDDHIVLDMLGFDIILGMDWLSPNCVVLDLFAKTDTLVMPSIPLVV